MIVDSMSKQEVMQYIRKEYNSTILPHFHKHLKFYESKIYPVCDRGKQKKVTIPWEIIQSKDRTVFHLQVFGNKESINSVTIAEFDWQKQHCFAYIKHDLMIVFSEHALRRYEERVWGNDINTVSKVKQSFKILLKYIPLSYRTILPSPTHPLCYYYVVLNALFLGDFDETTYMPDQKEGEIWLNTCISLKETGVSQTGILNTLSLMPYYIKTIGFNPFDSDVRFEKTYALRTNPKIWRAVQCLSKSVYLIDKLFVMMDLPVSNTVIDVFNSEMKYAGALLNLCGIDISKLTPYGANGIALRGELDYKGKT
jgi:hypothetical protein